MGAEPVVPPADVDSDYFEPHWAADATDDLSGTSSYV